MREALQSLQNGLRGSSRIKCKPQALDRNLFNALALHRGGTLEAAYQILRYLNGHVQPSKYYSGIIDTRASSNAKHLREFSPAANKPSNRGRQNGNSE